MQEVGLNNAIIHTKDIINLFPNERTMDRKLKCLIDRDQLRKIKNGLYATVNPITNDVFVNRFEIASNLFDNACVAYHSALEYYGLANQMFTDVHVYTDKRNVSFYNEGLVYKFIQTNIKAGIVTHNKNAIIRVTDIERTIIDCIDRISLAGGLEEVVSALNGITFLNEDKLKEYLLMFNEKFLFKKVGFLLSKFKKDIISNDFLVFCNNKISLKIDDISENKKLPRLSDGYWKIIYPKYIINMEN